MSFRENLCEAIRQNSMNIPDEYQANWTPAAETPISRIIWAINNLDSGLLAKAYIKIPRHVSFHRTEMVDAADILRNAGYEVFDVSYNGMLNVKSFRMRFTEVI